MKQRYHPYRRENGIYYSLDALTNNRQSLQTTDPEAANCLLDALNEACKQPAINLQIAQVYLQHSDPGYGKRHWQNVIDELGKNKTGPTHVRGTTARPAAKVCRHAVVAEVLDAQPELTRVAGAGNHRQRRLRDHFARAAQSDGWPIIGDQFLLPPRPFVGAVFATRLLAARLGDQPRGDHPS